MKFSTKLLFPIAGLAAFGLSSCGRGGDTETINIAGSDTMLEVGLSWSDAYKSVDSDVSISIAADGSSTGFAALVNGTADLAHSSRAIKDSEKKAIMDKHGIAPIEHIVGFDGIAIYMHKDNPVKSLSLTQLREIWGEGGKIDNWNQIGGSDAEIQRVGRSNSSGTYGYFQKKVLGKGEDGKGIEFKPKTGAMAGSKAVVENCETTPNAIGYSGMSYKTDKVGWLAISEKDGGEPVMPSIENVQNQTYPIFRPLYIYTVGDPKGKAKEYLDWIKSPAGQKIVSDQGFVPKG